MKSHEFSSGTNRSCSSSSAPTWSQTAALWLAAATYCTAETRPHAHELRLQRAAWIEFPNLKKSRKMVSKDGLTERQLFPSFTAGFSSFHVSSSWVYCLISPSALGLVSMTTQSSFFRFRKFCSHIRGSEQRYLNGRQKRKRALKRFPLTRSSFTSTGHSIKNTPKCQQHSATQRCVKCE